MALAELVSYEWRAIAPDVKRTSGVGPSTTLIQDTAQAPSVKRSARVYPWYTYILYQANTPSVKRAPVPAEHTEIVYLANAPTVGNTGQAAPGYGLIVWQALTPSVRLVPFSIIPITGLIEYRAQDPVVRNAPGVVAPTAYSEWRAGEPTLGPYRVETAHVVFRAQGQGGVEGAVVHFKAQEIAGVARVAQWCHWELSAIEPDVSNELKGAGGGHVVGPPVRIRQDGGQRQVPTTTRRGTLFNA